MGAIMFYIQSGAKVDLQLRVHETQFVLFITELFSIQRTVNLLLPLPELSSRMSRSLNGRLISQMAARKENGGCLEKEEK